jgi:NADPH-dependent curcumin reductase CurA
VDVIVEATSASSVCETMFRMARLEAHIIFIGHHSVYNENDRLVMNKERIFLCLPLITKKIPRIDMANIR